MIHHKAIHSRVENIILQIHRAVEEFSHSTKENMKYKR